MSQDVVKKVRMFLYLIVLVVLVGALLNVPADVTNWIVNLIIGLIISSVCSFTAGSLVEAFSGDFFKKIALNIEIFGHDFSITIFAIVTFIVEKWLFGF